LYRQINVYH